MKDVFKGKYRISSIRLEGYDYGTDGAYFITICSHKRKERFSKILNGKIFLSPLGEIIQEEIIQTSIVRQFVTVDEFVVMPNHVHLIVFIHQDSKEPDHLLEKGADLYFPENYRNQFGPQRRNLASVMIGFKGMVTRRAMKAGLGTPVWQERYYEHIIRNKRELERIRMYVKENPFQWEWDEENSQRKCA